MKTMERRKGNSRRKKEQQEMKEEEEEELSSVLVDSQTLSDSNSRKSGNGCSSLNHLQPLRGLLLNPSHHPFHFILA